MNGQAFRDGSRQWGDFQTPLPLAREVCSFLYAMGCRPKLIIEPTCGQGHFLQAAADVFAEARLLYGVEVQPAYVQRARQALAGFAGEVSIHQGDVFGHVFPEVDGGDEVLVLGNPPWVTNTELSSLASGNLPVKQNLKGHTGMEAMTGKSNFDISEHIIMRLLERFGECRGHLAMLCKNAVVRNLVRELPRWGFPVGPVQAYKIDAARAFGASVDASLLVIRLGAGRPEAVCHLYDAMGAATKRCTFGWSGGKFVADLDAYQRWRSLDGVSPYVWRQGLKHDLAPVMELTGADGTYQNGLGESVALEPEALFPLLKSSDLQGYAGEGARFWVPVTQRRLGEETAWIADTYPLLWAYLERHRARFGARKSAIYRGKPPYALFGIGEYSFAPYKVAISGLYKSGRFILVPPLNGRPVLLDDTCYFLPFDSYQEALRVCNALNSPVVQEFLRSVVFLDAKRPYTKELLMRIDLDAVWGEIMRG